LLCACQAADIRGVESLSSATRKLYDVVREKVPYLDHDEPMTDHLEAIADLYQTGALLKALPPNVDAYDW